MILITNTDYALHFIFGHGMIKSYLKPECVTYFRWEYEESANRKSVHRGSST